MFYPLLGHLLGLPEDQKNLVFLGFTFNQGFTTVLTKLICGKGNPLQRDFSLLADPYLRGLAESINAVVYMNMYRVKIILFIRIIWFMEEVTIFIF